MVTTLKNNGEAFFWSIALLLLALIPLQNLPSLCIAKQIGFLPCIGCGIGHSIQAAFRGNIQESWQWHPMGIFAILILLHRIFTLTHKPKTKI
jgi:Protein of unknown function (DUF2752)